MVGDPRAQVMCGFVWTCAGFYIWREKINTRPLGAVPAKKIRTRPPAADAAKKNRTRPPAAGAAKKIRARPPAAAAAKKNPHTFPPAGCAKKTQKKHMSTSSSHLFAKDLLTTPRKKAHVRRQTGRHREKKHMSPSSTCPRQAAGRAEKNPHTSAGRRPREKDPYTSAQRRPREKKSAHVPCRRRRPGWERVLIFFGEIIT
eukprot:gene10802-biopygen3321